MFGGAGVGAGLELTLARVTTIHVVSDAGCERTSSATWWSRPKGPLPTRRKCPEPCFCVLSFDQGGGQRGLLFCIQAGCHGANKPKEGILCVYVFAFFWHF